MDTARHHPSQLATHLSSLLLWLRYASSTHTEMRLHPHDLLLHELCGCRNGSGYAPISLRWCFARPGNPTPLFCVIAVANVPNLPSYSGSHQLNIQLFHRMHRRHINSTNTPPKGSTRSNGACVPPGRCRGPVWGECSRSITCVPPLVSFDHCHQTVCTELHAALSCISRCYRLLV